MENKKREDNYFSVQLLDNHLDGKKTDDLKDRIEKGKLIESLLQKKGINLTFEGVYSNPPSDGYNFLSNDVPLECVLSLKEYLKKELKAESVRIFNFKYKTLIEISKERRSFPSLKDILSFTPMHQEIPLILGEGENDKIFIEDVTNIDNLLIGGENKKEVLMFADIFLTTLLYRKTPKEVKVVLIGDAFKKYNGIPHLLDQVVTEKEDVKEVLLKIRTEMHERIDAISSSGLGSLNTYNRIMVDKRMPEIVVLIDKLGRLIEEQGVAITQFVSDIAQRGRYAGIYIMGFVNTSRLVSLPITLPNILHRITFHTKDEEESKLIIGEEGGECLLGEGDMLISGFSTSPRRIQAPLLTDKEVERVLREAKNKSGYGVWELDEDYINL